MPSLPTTTFSTNTIRVIPGGDGAAAATTTRAAALALARDHVAVVQLNPLLARYERLSSGPAGVGSASEGGDGGGGDDYDGLTRETYLITETMSYVPGTHLLDRELSFELDVVDTAAGLRTVARAPMGFVSEQEWVVREAGEGGRCVVEERVTATCPWGLRWFVEGTMRKSHETILGRFVEKVAAEVKQKGRE
ncbi:uncharacterized protein LTHEOB_7601 [Neofusicoccum parvum]|uniref:Uncharacterized protein LTHEOB_7601 n=1 Tax=Neofusicoccum parvum TaxID=310453 RepID=A0ACB5SP81_9PEZI|nr:uncharacterized protein LTHEOB_7601 [Neofusicoccum parvum]GME59254.1 uncharacterized protein LTHEOB_7601 [Neofusicoccum parvum]